MSIHLSEDDRNCLERLANRPMRPTRRQKAVALLDLGEGQSPARAAEHAGIPKGHVEALAAGFADGGLAGIGLDARPSLVVRLVRPGVRARTYRLPEGVTLAELLHRSGAATTGQVVYVDGVAAGEKTPLHDGAIVMIVPQPRNGEVAEPWRLAVPSFQDDALFQQYMEIMRDRRRAPEPDEEEES
jgi:sulfur carrier protein ThiS